MARVEDVRHPVIKLVVVQKRAKKLLLGLDAVGFRLGFGSRPGRIVLISFMLPSSLRPRISGIARLRAIWKSCG